MKFLTMALFLWLFGHIIYTVFDGLKDEKSSADVALILGNKVNKDGTISKRLEKRLDCGLNLYKTGRVKKIIVSGGLGKEGHFEGNKMKDYLVSKNVPDSVIIVDNFGNNTTASVINTLKIKDKIQFNSLIIVSQYYHLTRTKMLFRKLKFNKISSVSPKYFEFRDVYSLLREFAAYYTQYFRTIVVPL